MKKTTRTAGTLSTLLLLAAQAGWAQQDVQVSTGYYDLPNGSGGGTLDLPDPWYGSASTTFFGSSSLATSGDPDEDAILLQNLGSTSVTLSAANFGGSQYLFSLDSISSPITLLPNQYYILAGVDGSDVGFTDVVNLTLGGNSYSYNDAVDSTFYPNGVLHGFPSSGNETVPWTAIYTPTFGDSVPDSGSCLELMAPVLLGFVGLQRKFRRGSAA